jgi:hypothetical protein
MDSGEAGYVSFVRDIKPLFRTKDQESMRRAFDLSDYEDVARHADAILGALQSGKMPCDVPGPRIRCRYFSGGLTAESNPDRRTVAGRSADS